MIEKYDIRLSEYNLTDEEGYKFVDGVASVVCDEVVLIEDDNGAILWEDGYDVSEQGIPASLWQAIEYEVEQAEAEADNEPDGFSGDEDYWKWKEG